MNEQVRLLQIQQMYDSKLAEYKWLGKTDSEFVYVQLSDYTFLLSRVAQLEAERDALKRGLKLVLPLAKGYSPPDQTDSAKATCWEWIRIAQEAASLSEQEEKESVVVCDGCGEEIDYGSVGTVHETWNADNEPEYCGRLIKLPTASTPEEEKDGS